MKGTWFLVEKPDVTLCQHMFVAIYYLNYTMESHLCTNVHFLHKRTKVLSDVWSCTFGMYLINSCYSGSHLPEPCTSPNASKGWIDNWCQTWCQNQNSSNHLHTPSTHAYPWLMTYLVDDFLVPTELATPFPLLGGGCCGMPASFKLLGCILPLTWDIWITPLIWLMSCCCRLNAKISAQLSRAGWGQRVQLRIK